MITDRPGILEQIDTMLAEHDPARQPMLSMLADGRLSRDELRTFATQYYHLMEALPRFVSTVHSVTIDHLDIRRTLLNILVPLELNPPSIAEMWLHTCASIGLFSDSVRTSETTPATSVCLGDFDYLCREGSAQGLAALYAWMSRLPRVCRIEQTAFAEHYGLVEGPGVRFFEIAGFQAQSHTRALRGALTALLQEYPEAEPAAFDAARAAVAAVEGMYSGALSHSR